MLISFVLQRHFLGATIVAMIAGAIIGCQREAGPARFDVTGVVSVDGTPADGMLVQLQRQDAGNGNDQYPSCISDASGKFQFGGESASPGLIAGDYVATFAWLEGKDLQARDELQGRFSQLVRVCTPPLLSITDLSSDAATLWFTSLLRPRAVDNF